MHDAHFIKFVFYFLCITVLVKEGVCNDEATFLAHYIFQLIQSNRQAAFFEVNFFRGSHPEHVLSPLSNSFDIDQVFYTNIFGYGVSSPGTTAKCQGRNKFEVVKVSDATLRRRSIDQDTTGLHGCCMFCHFFFLIYIDVKGRCMSVSAVSYELFCFCNCFIKCFCFVHGKYRRQFLMRKFFTDVYRFYFTDQDLGFCRNFYTCHLSDRSCFLSNDLCIQCAVDQNCFSYFFDFVFLKEIASSVLELFFYCFIYTFQNCYRLFGCTDHTIVKCFGVDDGVYCKTDIGSIINDNRCVSGSNTKCRFSGGICCLNHSRTACCKDDVCFFHYHVGKFQTRYVDPSDDAFRCACFHCCFKHNFGSFDSASFCTRMWADDDCISCLQRDQSFEDCGGSRVCSRDNCCDQSDRFCNFLDSVNRIFFDHTTGLCVFVCIVDVFRCIVIFDDFIFNNTHSCFFYSCFCKRDTRFVSSSCSGFEDLVYLLLCVSGEKFLCFFHRSDLCFQCFRSVNDCRDVGFFLCHF